MESLPNLVNYSEPLSVLPDGMQNYSVTCTPVNGSSFGPSAQIIVDLNNVGYLDPASLMIRYNVTYTTTSATATGATQGIYGAVSGCPVYSPFLRLDTLMNSNVIESVNNYNSVCSLLSNVNMSVAGKLGQQYALGYASDNYEFNESTDGFIGGVVGTGSAQVLTKTLYLSAPLPCLLSNAEKLIPLNGTNIRLQFTTDSMANFCPLVSTTDVTGAQTFTTIAGTITGLCGLASTVVTANAASRFTGMTINNFEIVYNQVQFPPHIDQEIRMQSPKIRIKTTSFATGTQTIANATGGTVNLIYNLRYASIKGLFLMNGGTTDGGTSKNKLFDSFDITRGTGSYNFNINGLNYPQNPMSTLTNKAFLLQELRRTMNNIYQNNVDMSINANEYALNDGSQSSVYIPAKFFVAVNTQRLSVPYKTLFTGISSQNSPINAVINCGTATMSQNITALLAINYDAILEIDLATKQINYIY